MIKMTIVLISTSNPPEKLSKTFDLIDLIGIDLKKNWHNKLVIQKQWSISLAFYSNKLCKQKPKKSYSVFRKLLPNSK